MLGEQSFVHHVIRNYIKSGSIKTSGKIGMIIDDLKNKVHIYKEIEFQFKGTICIKKYLFNL